MKRTEAYGNAERRAIASSLRAGRELVCPRCGSRLDEWPVPPRRDVSYVRDRIWLVCAPCSRSVVLDRESPEG